MLGATRNLPGCRVARVLGIVRRCATCGEEWPLDNEFFASKPGRRPGSRTFSLSCRACVAESDVARRRRARDSRTRMLLGPLPCASCGARVVYARIKGIRAWFDPATLTEHRCGH